MKKNTKSLFFKEYQSERQKLLEENEQLKKQFGEGQKMRESAGEISKVKARLFHKSKQKLKIKKMVFERKEFQIFQIRKLNLKILRIFRFFFLSNQTNFELKFIEFSNFFAFLKPLNRKFSNRIKRILNEFQFDSTPIFC